MADESSVHTISPKRQRSARATQKPRAAKADVAKPESESQGTGVLEIASAGSSGSTDEIEHAGMEALVATPAPGPPAPGEPADAAIDLWSGVGRETDRAVSRRHMVEKLMEYPNFRRKVIRLLIKDMF